jgi:mRNA-degrading endonuclease YafQ of YafQ-DinJ toxin-antitoxin module
MDNVILSKKFVKDFEIIYKKKKQIIVENIFNEIINEKKLVIKIKNLK